jgi:hypothetical protein
MYAFERCRKRYRCHDHHNRAYRYQPKPRFRSDRSYDALYVGTHIFLEIRGRKQDHSSQLLLYFEQIGTYPGAVATESKCSANCSLACLATDIVGALIRIGILPHRD